MLKNETIIITGGSSGMGLAMAKQFVAEGANVVITGRDKTRLQEAKMKYSQLEVQLKHFKWMFEK